MGVPSGTENLADTLDTHRGAVEDLRGRLQYAEGASGIAVALDGRVISIDLLDKAETLAKIWDRLAQGIVLDALEVRGTGCPATDTSGSVRLYMDKMRSVTWHQADSVGLGERYHARDHGMLAAALVMDGTLIHLSMSMPV
jgi:hypothetical protein